MSAIPAASSPMSRGAGPIAVFAVVALAFVSLTPGAGEAVRRSATVSGEREVLVTAAPGTAAPTRVSAREQAPPVPTTTVSAHEALKGLGYASERNTLRWQLIGPVLVEAAESDGAGDLRVLDFGADQGFFTLMAALTLRERAPSRRAEAWAVEKGGVGGALWKKKGTMNVHKQIAAAAARVNLTGSAVKQCATTVTAKTFAALAKPSADGVMPCAATAQFVLSMLHWVDGVDGPAGFDDAICNLARNAAVTVLELPHPSAKGTYGVQRYAKWYAGVNGTTGALNRAVASCRDVSLRLVHLGRTPWGPPAHGLHRDLHAVWNDRFRRPRHSTSCSAVLGC